MYTSKYLGTEEYSGDIYYKSEWSVKDISVANGQITFTIQCVCSGTSMASQIYYLTPENGTREQFRFGSGLGPFTRQHTLNGYTFQFGASGMSPRSVTVDPLGDRNFFSDITLSGTFAAGNLKAVSTLDKTFSNLTYNISYTIGSKSATNSNPGTSVTRTFDSSWYAGLPNATSGTLTVTGTVNDGKNNLQVLTKTLAVTIPDSVKPTISNYSVSDANGYARYIKSLSAVKPSATVAAGTGSTIKSISLKVGTMAAATKTDGTMPVSSALTVTGTVACVLTATDNRNRTATASVNITVYDKADLVGITLSGTFVDGNLKAVMSYTLPKSSGYSASVTYTLGSKSETPSSFAASTTKTFDSSWYAGLPNATSGTLTVVVTIKEGNTTWSTKTATLAVTIPDTVKPSISAFTVAERLTTVPSSWGIYVNGLSALKINTLTWTAGTGANKSKVKLKVGSMAEKEGTVSSLPQGDAFTSSGTIAVTVTVIDSRNRSATASVNVTVYDYAAPAFSSAVSERCNASGVSDDEGTRFKVTTGITFSSCNGKNSVTLKVEIKQSTASSYGTAQTISPNTTVLCNQTISANYAYDVRLTLTDAFNTAYHYDYISTALYLIHFKTGGTGIAFGQKATIDDMFDCNFKATFRKAVTFTKSGGGTVTIQDLINNVGEITTGSNGVVAYRKIGKFVDFVITGTALSEYNKWITLGTLPEGYRPATVHYFMGYNNNAGATANASLEMRVGTDGIVAVWPFAANVVPRGSLMFTTS